jgi:hypothetical protein
MEFSYPPDLRVHPHVHDGEDEMFYLLAGELAGFCGDSRWTARPPPARVDGCYLTVQSNMGICTLPFCPPLYRTCRSASK